MVLCLSTKKISATGAPNSASPGTSLNLENYLTPSNFDMLESTWNTSKTSKTSTSYSPLTRGTSQSSDVASETRIMSSEDFDATQKEHMMNETSIPSGPTSTMPKSQDPPNN